MQLQLCACRGRALTAGWSADSQSQPSRSGLLFWWVGWLIPSCSAGSGPAVVGPVWGAAPAPVNRTYLHKPAGLVRSWSDVIKQPRTGPHYTRRTEATCSHLDFISSPAAWCLWPTVWFFGLQRTSWTKPSHLHHRANSWEEQSGSGPGPEGFCFLQMKQTWDKLTCCV